jgi:hypothetical protein
VEPVKTASAPNSIKAMQAALLPPSHKYALPERNIDSVRKIFFTVIRNSTEKFIISADWETSW